MDKPKPLLTDVEFYQLQNGNAVVFRKIYDAYFALLHYVAIRCGLTSNEAGDVVQDTFIKLHEKAGDLQSAEGIKAWLVTTARNRSLDLLRQKKSAHQNLLRQGAESRIEDPEDDSLDSLWHELQVSLVKQLIDNVCEETSDDSFRLFYVDGLSAKDIADKKGEPVSTVTNRLSRLRNRYKESFRLHLEKIRESTA